MAYLCGRTSVEVDVMEAMYDNMINLVSSVLFSDDVFKVGVASA